MSTERYTLAECTAYEWMRRVFGWGMSTGDERDMHDAGNEVIRMAEQIKAERAVSGMGK